MELTDFGTLEIPLIEILLGVMIGVLLMIVILQWAKLRAVRRLLAEEPKVEPEPVTLGASTREMEQDLGFLVDYIKELPKLMSELNAQTEVRQIPPVLLNAMARIFRAEQAATTERLIAEFCFH